MSKKKPEIVIPDQLLAGKTTEEQTRIREAVADAFKDFDFDKPSGKIVRPLADGVIWCPDCGGKLHKDRHATQLPDGVGPPPLTGKIVHFIECPKCDSPFMQEAKS